MQPGDEQERLRKMLKDLPKVPARPDFEERLQRRIVAAGKERRLWFAPRHWPALAYSALTVLVVGVVSYLALERAGLRDAPGPPATLSDSAVLLVPAPGVTAPSESHVSSKGESPASGTVEAPAAKFSRNQQKAKQAEVEQEYRQDQGDVRDLQNEQELQIPEQDEVQEQHDERVQPVPPPAEAAKPAMREEQKAQEPVQMLGIDADKPETAAPRTLDRTKMRALTASPYARAEALEDTLLTESELALIDSIARHDSVKADSVRKALLLKRRPKKP